MELQVGVDLKKKVYKWEKYLYEKYASKVCVWIWAFCHSTELFERFIL